MNGNDWISRRTNSPTQCFRMIRSMSSLQIVTPKHGPYDTYSGKSGNTWPATLSCQSLCHFGSAKSLLRRSLPSGAGDNMRLHHCEWVCVDRQQPNNCTKLTWKGRPGELQIFVGHKGSGNGGNGSTHGSYAPFCQVKPGDKDHKKGETMACKHFVQISLSNSDYQFKKTVWANY